MKGKDRADQYHSYYSVLRKTVKWSKKLKWYCICYTVHSLIHFLCTVH